MKKKLLLFLLAIGLIFVPFGNLTGAQSVKKVVIDAGHGGSDPGAVGNGLREKDLTLKIASKIDENLKDNYVVETMMTRYSDTFPTLKERTDSANSWGADLFLSVHINAFNGKATGYEDYVYTKPSSEDIKVQNAIHEEVSKVLEEYGVPNRGKKKANFHVLRESKMASILLEILFIDHATDAKLLKEEEFLNDISKAISTGVANALELPDKNGDSVVSGTPSSQPPVVSKASGAYIVTASSLTVRTGDGTNYPSIGSLKKNQKINVTGLTSKGWYRFTFNGKTAYVSGAYLKPAPTAKPVSKPKSDPIKVSKASGTYIVTASSLNVRSGNGTQYKSIGSLKKNNQVKVTGKTSNNWYRITYKGKTGYVSGAYLKKKPASAPMAKPKSANAIKVTKASGTYRVTASSLNVRSGNKTSYSKVGSLKRGTKVKVTGKTSNGWYRINHNGKVGFVSGKYLKR